MGGAGGFGADRGASGMRGGHHAGSELGGGFRTGPERHANGRHRRGGFYDYGYDNNCLDYPPYYRRNPSSCYW
jgi:hypothetical protein